MFEVFFSEKAKKDFQILSDETKKLVSKKLVSFQKNPASVRIRKIVNSKNYFRLRVGDFRVVFEKEGKLIKIFRIRHRNEIYRKIF